MLNRLLFIVACTLLAISLILSIGYAYDNEVATQVPTYTYENGTSGTKITEDDPRWNCHTMGNHICGNNR